MKGLKLLVSIGVSLAAGAIGSIVTISNISTWYAALDKPWFNPPNWLFGPVWTTLYILMGISLYLIWTAPSKKNKRFAYRAFAAQLVLNSLWSIAFFGLHQPWGGVVIILLLLGAIILTMREFWRFSQLAVWLLVPYVVWVGFATCLNVAVAFLN